MKRKMIRWALICILLIALVPMSALATESNVAIDETNFPDATFRYLVASYLDWDQDGTLSQEERMDVTFLNLVEEGIYSLKGIEYFPALVELQCNTNYLTSLDLSGNPKLEYLGCWENNLTELDVSKNPELLYLYCFDNALTKLDLRNNPKLEEINCGKNNLTALDVSRQTALIDLCCRENQLTAIDVSNNRNLTYFEAHFNPLKELDVTNNTALEYLYCGNSDIASIDLSRNPALVLFSCGDGNLTELDVSHNSKLTKLWLQRNRLTSLNLSNNYALESFAPWENSCPIRLGANRRFDLSTLPGDFNVRKASNWRGGTVSGNILTVNSNATSVYYTYDCGNGKTADFCLQVDNSSPFTDVQPFAPYYDAAVWALRNGVTAGMGDGRFGVGSTCTRAQVMTFLYAAKWRPDYNLSYLNKFTDANEGDWYAPYVAWAVENGITAGTTPTTFGPNDTCTVNQVITFLWAAMGRETPAQMHYFTDVPASDWYCTPISWAVENGVLEGRANGSIGGYEPCSRENIILYLYRFLG